MGENPRKRLEPLQVTKGKDAVNKALLDGKESQNRRGTMGRAVLFCTAIGREIILFVTYFTKYQRDTEIGGTAASGKVWKKSCSGVVR